MTLESIEWIWTVAAALFGLFIIILLGFTLAVTIQTGVRMLRKSKEDRKNDYHH